MALPDFIEDWLAKQEKRTPGLRTRLIFQIAALLSAGTFSLWSYLQIDSLIPPAIALRLAQLLPSTGILLLGACVAFYVDRKKPSPAKSVAPAFAKLDQVPEKLLQALSHAEKPELEADIIEGSNLSRPVVLHALESMYALKYLQNHYDYAGRSWSCAALGRAYLAHHGLI